MGVLLDVITEDDKWMDWSSGALEEAAASWRLVINPIIYAEVALPAISSAGCRGQLGSIEGLTLLTRDPRKYRTYFPKLHLIAP